MKSALIRADGSSKLGMGHLTRTIDLANELKKKDYEITFLTKNYLEGITLIKINGFHIIKLNPSDEIKEIDKILVSHNKFFEFILVDLQHIKNQEDINYLKKFCTKLYLISDDISPLYIDVDAIFAITLNQEEINYKNIKNTKYYTGLNYFPLNRKFKEVGSKIIKKEVSNILLTFGGADPKNYSNFLISILKKMNLNATITIIIGSAFPNELFEKCFHNKTKNIIIKRNISNMITYFFEADLCVCSAGNTVIELLTCGVPCIVLPQTDIENERAIILEKKQMMINLGLDFEEEKLISKIEQLLSDYSMRKRFSINSQSYLDGKGINRIIEIISRNDNL